MNLENAKVTKIGLGEESSKIGWGVYENAKVTKLENAKVTKIVQGGGGYENAKVIELETAKVTKQENTKLTEIDGGFMKMQKLQNWKMQKLLNRVGGLLKCKSYEFGKCKSYEIGLGVY